MCFNSEVSLATYFTGLAGSYKLYKINKVSGIFIFSWVVQMQLIDHIIWKNSERLEDRKKKNMK